ncbi:hypothetical protein AX17_004031 [Amanita inopinata Kibby_2008]|nr:hypothetical protein AX17_004031 [Amanita inopinata Kibby_2008]
MASFPKVMCSTELAASEARWITLRKLQYIDSAGKERTWECAERKTPVAILPILRSQTNAFALSTVIIEQYRPPIDRCVIGLVDENESCEEAAIRELYEETGYVSTKVLESSPVIVNDPGMTSANMMLVVLDVIMKDKLETPTQHLDVGEHIIKRVVSLETLESELQEYSRKGYSVDARLFHFATGYAMAKKLKYNI